MAQVGSGVLSNGYFVRILEGEIIPTNDGNEIALKEGSHFRIFVMNNNVHACQMGLRQGNSYIGTYLLQGRSAYVFEQPADGKCKFIYSEKKKDLGYLKINFMPEKFSTCMKFLATSFTSDTARRATFELFDFNTYRELRMRMHLQLGPLTPHDLVLRVAFPNPRHHGRRSVEAVLPREPTDSFLYHYHFSEIISENYGIAIVKVKSLSVVNQDGEGITFDLTQQIPTVKEVIEEVLSCDKFGESNTIRLMTSGGRNIYLPHWTGLVPLSDDPVLTLFLLEEMLQSTDLVVMVSNEELLDVSLFHIYLKSVTGDILSGKSVLLRRVDNHLPVQMLMQLIEAQEGIPCAFQRLVYNGVIMQRGLTLADYHLHLGSTVHLVLQLLGRSDMHLDVKVKKINEVVSVSEDAPDAAKKAALPIEETHKPHVRYVSTCGIPVDPSKETTLKINMFSREGDEDEPEDELAHGMLASPRLQRKLRLRVDYQEGERLNLSLSERDRSYDTSGTESEGRDHELPRRRVLVKKLSDIMHQKPGTHENGEEDELPVARQDDGHVIAVIEKHGSRVTGSRIEMLGSKSTPDEHPQLDYNQNKKPPTVKKKPAVSVARTSEPGITTTIPLSLSSTKGGLPSAADDSGFGADDSFTERQSQSSAATQPPSATTLDSCTSLSPGPHSSKSTTRWSGRLSYN